MQKLVHAAEVKLLQPTARELAAFAGRYLSDEIRTEWMLSVSDGKLVATGPAFDQPAALSSAVKHEYCIMAIGAVLRFTRDGIRFDRAR